MKASFSKACFFFVMAAWLISCKTNSGSPVSPADNSDHHGGVLQPDSTVLEILSLTSADSLQYFVRELTGEQAVIIDGVADTIESRTRGSEGHLTAMKYISQKLQSYGLEVRLQNFFVTGTNVIATQPGTDFQNRKYLIGAHYDNRETNRLTVPGADDNASGVASVLEAARLLSRHKPRYTIIYALWDQEELGLQGSGYFAVEAWSRGDSLLGVLNLDMIGWDSNNDGVVEIQSNLLPQTSEFVNTPLQCNIVYAIGLKPGVYVKMTTNSDYASFWNAGFDAIGFSEAYWGGDFNPYYHTSGDSLSHFNLTYYYNCSKLAVATIATLAAVRK